MNPKIDITKTDEFDIPISELKSIIISGIMKLSNEDCYEILQEIKREVAYAK